MKRLRWLVVGAGVVGGIALVLLRFRREAGPSLSLNGHRPVERRSRSDPDALRAQVEGSASRVGLNRERLK